MATGVFAVQRSKLIVPIAMEKTGVARRVRQRRAGIVRSGPAGATFRNFSVFTSGASPLV